MSPLAGSRKKRVYGNLELMGCGRRSRSGKTLVVLGRTLSSNSESDATFGHEISLVRRVDEDCRDKRPAVHCLEREQPFGCRVFADRSHLRLVKQRNVCAFFGDHLVEYLPREVRLQVVRPVARLGGQAARRGGGRGGGRLAQPSSFRVMLPVSPVKLRGEAAQVRGRVADVSLAEPRGRHAADAHPAGGKARRPAGAEQRYRAPGSRGADGGRDAARGGVVDQNVVRIGACGEEGEEEEGEEEDGDDREQATAE